MTDSDAGSADNWWQAATLDGTAEAALDRELKIIAAARLRAEATSSMSTHDLVNEAVLKLSSITKMEWKDRPHVLAMASTLMRRILIDHARRRQADKRAHDKVTLVTGLPAEEPALELMALDLALKELKEIDPERAKVVEMRFFGGMTNEEIASALGLSEATVKRRWAAARAWLYGQLNTGQ